MEGNNKLREALKELQSRLVAGVYDGSIDCHAALMVVEKALAEPPRQCEVGTPEEQSARFDDHCKRHMGCITCPLREKDGGVPKHCEFAWAQMPYESEVKK